MYNIYSLLKRITSKKVILVQKDHSIKIYSKFKTLLENKSISKYVNPDMSLKNGEKYFTLNNENSFLAIYTADLKGDNSHLNDYCLLFLNQLHYDNDQKFNINMMMSYISLFLIVALYSAF